jgi:hypothetical protein
MAALVLHAEAQHARGARSLRRHHARNRAAASRLRRLFALAITPASAARLAAAESAEATIRFARIARTFVLLRSAQTACSNTQMVLVAVRIALAKVEIAWEALEVCVVHLHHATKSALDRALYDQEAVQEGAASHPRRAQATLLATTPPTVASFFAVPCLIARLATSAMPALRALLSFLMGNFAVTTPCARVGTAWAPLEAHIAVQLLRVLTCVFLDHFLKQRAPPVCARMGHRLPVRETSCVTTTRPARARVMSARQQHVVRASFALCLAV